MLKRLLALTLPAVLVVLVAVGTASPDSRATKAQAIAAGWDCSPNITILGYFHCSPPGHPSLLDVITGAAKPPSLILRVYDGETNLYAGTEQLLRADLFADQPCRQEGGDWGFLDFAPPAADYYGCHHFAA
jgi:hypothetical protein